MKATAKKKTATRKKKRKRKENNSMFRRMRTKVPGGTVAVFQVTKISPEFLLRQRQVIRQAYLDFRSNFHDPRCTVEADVSTHCPADDFRLDRYGECGEPLPRRFDIFEANAVFVPLKQGKHVRAAHQFRHEMFARTPERGYFFRE